MSLLVPFCPAGFAIIPFSSLFSQSKCSTRSQVMFNGVGLLNKCLNFLQTESSLPNLILKNNMKRVPWMSYSTWEQERMLLTELLSVLMALVFYEFIWLEAVLGFFWFQLWNLSKDVCLCTQAFPQCWVLLGYKSFGFEPPKESSIFHERWWDKQGLYCRMTPRVNNLLYSFQVLYYPDCHLNPGWHYSPST